MAALGQSHLKSGRNLPSQQCISQCFSLQRTVTSNRTARRQLQKAAALVLSVNQPYGPDPLEPPPQPPRVTLDAEQASSSKQPEKEKPLVRVQLSVHYRVHSRQMLCVGGSQIPFGWSFLSIAKVPMTWNQGDIWTCEDWTKLENEDSEGLVEVTYRSGSEPGRPPDIQNIQKQMAIVAWQPGPNRIVQVPTEAELSTLTAGQIVERVPARASSRGSYDKQQQPKKPDPYEGTWEILSLNGKGEPFLDRHDVWGWSPGSTNRPLGMQGFRFDS
eukprot:GHRR01012178.1.p1 GENE.GHRR01012178.1~~GHRR01012178.1.p1  ORF type:complete len:273 (+),score=52.98 GHRR01012178.1:335-1153(+)